MNPGMWVSISARSGDKEEIIYINVKLTTRIKDDTTLTSQPVSSLPFSFSAIGSVTSIASIFQSVSPRTYTSQHNYIGSDIGTPGTYTLQYNYIGSDIGTPGTYTSQYNYIGSDIGTPGTYTLQYNYIGSDIGTPVHRLLYIYLCISCCTHQQVNIIHK